MIVPCRSADADFATDCRVDLHGWFYTADATAAPTGDQRRKLVEWAGFGTGWHSAILIWLVTGMELELPWCRGKDREGS